MLMMAWGSLMAILVLHAPRTGTLENKRSFASTLASGIGDEYAIPQNLVAKLSSGCKVVLLNKDDAERAEGTLVELVPTSKAGNGIQRYNVRVADLKMVPYRSERLTRTGVAVI